VETLATASQDATPDSGDAGNKEDQAGAGRQFGRQVVLPLAGDQRTIWTAPFHLNRRQARFWVPAAAGAASLVLADQRLYRETTGRLSPAARNNMGKFSRLGNPAYMVGVSGGLWLVGNSGPRRPLRQTALLASRALIDDLLVVGVLKVALGRQRPPGDSFGGPPDGIRSGDYRSLPSGHSSAVWTMASVISSRHRQRWVPFVLYGFAGAVSITRVTSGRHFYGDVVPGALIGCSIGKMVVRRSQANP
jgi:undecaprenyl-diphosphatase